MNYIDKFVRDVSKDTNDIYLFGAGQIARDTRELLETNGIDITGYIVDTEYLPKNESDRSINGKPIVTEDALSGSVSVIVALLPCAGTDRLSTGGAIKKIYRVDLAGAFILHGQNILDENYLAENHGAIFDLYARLEDLESRSALMLYLTQKLTGTFEKEISVYPAYFDDEIITPHENEVFVDCGAYTGDTIAGFARFLKSHGISSYKKCIALEPDKQNFEALRRNLAGMSSIDMHCLGAYDSKTVLRFSSGSGETAGVSESGNIGIQADTIDHLVGDEDVTYIKMDIEGSELKALHGAEKTILRCRPRLAVCVYHRTEDLMTIPKYISSLHKDYKLYIRNYEKFGVDTVLYAV